MSEVEEVMSQLRLDSDRDVRFYCSPEAYQETTAYSDDTNSLNEYQVDFRLADQLSQWVKTLQMNTGLQIGIVGWGALIS